MKMRSMVVMVALLLISSVSFAANLDGTYKFVSRVKGDTPDLVSWTGTWKIAGNLGDKNFESPDKAEKKFYKQTLKAVAGKDGFYEFTMTDAYKKDYVGQVNVNKLSLNGKTLTLVSEDGKFKEIWEKQ